MSMRYRVLALVVLAGLLLAHIVHAPALAQDGSQRYENTNLGIAFDRPAGWEVEIQDNALIAAAPGDLQATREGAMPQGLVLRVIVGSFNELGIMDATELPALLTHLVASDVPAPVPEPVTWGNTSGYQTLVQLPTEGYTTRVALLAVTGGRVALLRGLAPLNAWEASAGTQFDALVSSLVFSLPERDEDYIASLTTNDGGIIWHYQEAQPTNGRVVRAGGIIFDMFDIMYMVAGPGGIASLDIDTGTRISFIGPWYGGDFVDVAIGPDTKLYLANVAPDTLNAVMVVDRAGNWLRGWGTRGDGEGQFAPNMPQTIAVDNNGDVWTVSEGHASGVTNRLYKFDEIGNLLQSIDLATLNPALSGTRITFNPSTGGLYVIGATGNLNVIDANGEALVTNLAQDVLANTTPVDLAVAPNNNIFVALAAPGLDGFGLLEFSVAGRLLDMFGFPYDAARGGNFRAGEYLTPAGLVVGPSGLGYWTETNPQTGQTQVQAFTFSGDGLIPLGVEMADSAAGGDSPLQSDPAHGGGSLAYGQSVRGALNNRYPVHNWTFEGTVGDHIRVTMLDATGAGLLDPQLLLVDSQGVTIASNDDAGPERPAELGPRDAMIDFFLPANGVYTIKATRFGGRGDYLLSLEQVP